ncbi:MAG: T9SS type A sorting domain-containing protein [Bacteroidales bacterium]|nr:T9SS type A sorting domain-containing protein [Bacteroidales bacterium]MBN2820131.1 T9SS type A sorting domain-containing protein [Bacteroidales bacterium]
MSRVFLVVLFLFQFTGTGFCQVTSSGIPYFNPKSDTFYIPEVTIEAYKNNILDYNNEPGFKNNQFAVPVELNISPEEYGKWVVYPKNNKKVWFIKIKAKQAKSLSLIISPFKLLPGAKLLIYDTLQTQIIGAITYRNNKESGILPVTTLNSGTIILELQVPLPFTEYGNINISTVGVEPENKSEFKSPMDQWYNTSRSCNLNVNCIHSSNIQAQKNSVCRIVYRGTQRCTGTLINNQRTDGKPYVITASHCISTDYLASTAVFSFNYESSDCENEDDSAQSISGATLVAAGYHIPSKPDTLDFSLLLLSEELPLDYYPYYSGWDATGVTPDSTYVIHHPNGDIKKIAYDSDAPATGDFENGFDSYTHWLIESYEVGTSEVGSSGAGLIDDKNRLIGTLTGGGLEPCVPLINDYYQKFSHAFNDYADTNCQLKYWLDPDNTGKLICDPYDYSGLLRKSATTISNFSSIDEFIDKEQNNNWGYLAGHNYQLNKSFAEKFEISGSVYLYGAVIYPKAAYSQTGESTLKFKLYKGGNHPGEVIYEKLIFLAEFDNRESHYIDFDSTVLVSNSFYFGFDIEYNADTFAVNYSSADNNKNTAFTFFNNEWKPLQLDNVSLPAHMAIQLLSFDMMPHKGTLPDSTLWSDISIYPNPVHEQVQILFKEKPDGPVKAVLYDLAGKTIHIEEYIEASINLPFPLNVEGGIYFLQVRAGNEKLKVFKLLVY